MKSDREMTHATETAPEKKKPAEVVPPPPNALVLTITVTCVGKTGKFYASVADEANEETHHTSDYKTAAAAIRAGARLAERFA